MPVNDQLPAADKSDTTKTVETDSKPKGLVKGLLGSVLNGSESAVLVPKADSTSDTTIQDPSEQSHEQSHGQNSEPESETLHKP